MQKTTQLQKTAQQIAHAVIVKVAQDAASPANRAAYDKLLAERKALAARFETTGLTPEEENRRGDITRALHGSQNWLGRPKFK